MFDQTVLLIGKTKHCHIGLAVLKFLALHLIIKKIHLLKLHHALLDSKNKIDKNFCIKPSKLLHFLNE